MNATVRTQKTTVRNASWTECPDGGARADRHEAACAMTIDPSPDRQPHECGGEEPERERPGERDPREAEVALHRREEDREAVVDDSPRDRLGDRQRPDDHPAVRN